MKMRAIDASRLSGVCRSDEPRHVVYDHFLLGMEHHETSPHRHRDTDIRVSVERAQVLVNCVDGAKAHHRGPSRVEGIRVIYRVLCLSVHRMCRFKR
jgi:hypothetical protein